MPRSYFDQETQIRNSGTYTDNRAPSLANFQTNAFELEYDLNSIRSMLHELRDVRTSNWYAALTAPSAFPGEGAAARGVQNVNVDLYDIERKRILRRRPVIGANITVPASAYAGDTLTLNSAPLNNETVTIGATVYTFKAVLTPANWEVLIEATASDSLDNLIWAINNTAGHPGKFQVPNAHPSVSAAAGVGDTMDVTALAKGTGGNTIAATETLSDVLSVWTTATLTGGAGDVVILDSAPGELPGNTTAAVGAVSTRGTVVASVFGSFGLAALTEVGGGASNIQPKNFCLIIDTSTGDPCLDVNGREIYALLQSEIATDGHTIDQVNQRVQLSFVTRNATYDDLILMAAGELDGKVIDYAPIERYAFEDVPEHAWLGDDFVDIGAGSATRQTAYDNQGIVPVDLITNATLDLEGAGLVWKIRDDAETDLFSITEGSGAGTTTIALGSDVDVFDNNAISNDFAKPLTVDSTGVDLQLGVTALANTATIDTLAGTDLRLMGTRELYLDDGNAPVGWSDTNGIKLSDTAGEWTDFETEFGEVSILNAIVQAKQSIHRATAWANVITADIPADTLVTGVGLGANISAAMPSYKGLTFVSDVEIYVNGAKQRPGANAAANHDVYPSAIAAEQADGAFYAEFVLKVRGVGGRPPDNINMVVWGHPTP